MRVLVVDNYDSFVYNLVQYLAQLGAEPVVRRNDAIRAEEIDDLGVAGVLLSPGPGHPDAAGACISLVPACEDRQVPLLGVCLGHQAIGVAHGATVRHAPELMHGKTSTVVHHRDGVLADLPSPFVATRYHSLAVDPDTLGDDLEVTGTTESGIVMALRVRGTDVEGVQFHPESVLTEGGHLLLARWLARCGLPEAVERAPALSRAVDEHRRRAAVPAAGAA